MVLSQLGFRYASLSWNFIVYYKIRDREKGWYCNFSAFSNLQTNYVANNL